MAIKWISCQIPVLPWNFKQSFLEKKKTRETKCFYYLLEDPPFFFLPSKVKIRIELHSTSDTFLHTFISCSEDTTHTHKEREKEKRRREVKEIWNRMRDDQFSLTLCNPSLQQELRWNCSYFDHSSLCRN